MTSPNRLVVWVALGLSVLVLTTGCRTVQVRSRPVAKCVRSFPPVGPAIVRLPVHLVFPGGVEVLKHLARLYQGGLNLFVPDLSAVPEAGTEPHLTQLWARMQEPIFLDDDFWLVLRPVTLGIGRARSDLKRADSTRFVLEMTARPEIVFGPKPEVVPIPMPPLQKFQAGPAIFRAMSNARFSYAEANDYFRKPEQKILGRVLSAKGERKLTLVGLAFHGEGGKVELDAKLLYDPPILNLTGHPSEMTVHLWGKPRFLPKQRVFDFPDLDFDVESGNLLVKLMDLLYKNHFRTMLRRLAKVPIGMKLDWMKGRIDLALNKPIGRFARLKTQAKSFKVIDAFADEEGIEIRVSIQGTAVLQVVWN